MSSDGSAGVSPDIRSLGDVQDVQDVQDVRDGQDVQDAQDVRDGQDVQDTQDVRDGKDVPGTGHAHDAQATLDAWRDSGAAHADPVRFQFMSAMARRTAALHGPARQMLDAKLAGLLSAYEASLNAPAPQQEAPPSDDAPSALAGLIDYLAYPDAPDGETAWTRDALGLREAYPDVQMLEYFRAVWSRVSADRQVRQSQEQVHKNAGPLNSNQLVHRALSLMRELSPGYLQQFLSYTDALMWMEQIQAATAPAPKDAGRAGSAKAGSAKTGSAKTAAAKKTSRAKAR
ncbi:DUF2894 domain-containing protein [Achromobacter kerstersii]|uniref:DUF2894 domain-containing protein n=1 Tax=Achromobacter kerstersii TaxID=1353890 RepID=UPI003209A656